MSKAERCRQIAEANFGKVLAEDDDGRGLAGLVPVFTGQTTALAPRRVVDMAGRPVVCPGDLVTTAFYRYRVGL
jgi:hypothetical protein